MSGVIEEIAANAIFWPGIYLGIGARMRYTSLRKLRQGPPMRPVPGYVYLEEPGPRDSWLKDAAPRHVLKARLWWAWPLALKRINETDIATVEYEIGQATLERMRKERDELERKLDDERRYSEALEKKEWGSSSVRVQPGIYAPNPYVGGVPNESLDEPEFDPFQDVLQRDVDARPRRHHGAIR